MKQNLDYVLRINNETFKGRWPLSPPSEGVLTAKQLKTVDKIIKTEISDIKKHFKDGAWDLDGHIIAGEVLYRIFGCHIEDYIICRTAKTCSVTAEWSSNGPLLKNEKQKVFYKTKGNRLYIDKKARDVDQDIQLGDL